MTIPLWVLLGFAAWTLTVLFLGVGVARWSAILAGRARLVDFPGDVPHGGARYRRLMRAHANCVENLPLYGAVAAAIAATGCDDAWLDTLAVTFLGARILQTLVHIVPEENDRSVALRFTFFAVQLACLIVMAGRVALTAT